jgi:succinate dehydrogenase / fumarate reductase flavoprotein subunit
MEFAELLCIDALDRNESCGGHFRAEHQTPEGEARRDDANFAHASVWEFTGVGNPPRKHREELTFESVPLAQRSYK